MPRELNLWLQARWSAHMWSAVACFAVVVGGQTQMVLDGKFGAAGPLTGPNFAVTADMGAVRGNNLFHSFAQFNLGAGEVARFSGPANVRNVLTRVTGGSPSSIDGAIHSEIAGANLFLINPNGVVFGPGAVVDVSGAFGASTANYLKLADGARFMASLDADDSALSSAAPVAFGFLDGPPSNLEVRGALHAGPGSPLSLVGGAVSVGDGARLEASQGRIELVGGQTAAEWPLPSGSAASHGSSVLGTSFANPLVKDSTTRDGENVVIRGGRLVVNNAAVSTAAGGGVLIELSDGLEVVNGGQIATFSSGSIRGGNIVISSPSVVVDGQDGALPTRIAAETSSEDPVGVGGDIRVQSESLELKRGAEISVSTFGSGDAGRVSVTTSLLRLQGSDMPQFSTQISANAAPVIGTSGGAGGTILIQANTVEIENGAGILAATTGDANAGSIEVTSDSVTLRNGAVSTFSAGAGHGGDIRVRAGGLTIDGPFASITATTSGQNDRLPAGPGGLIDIKTGILELLNDGAISANTFGDGNGGNVDITANSALLDTATFQLGSIPGITASSNPPFFGEGGGGRGGDISVFTESLTLRNGMPISAATLTAGDGGTVRVRTGALALDGGSTIQSASFGAGRAGTLSLESSASVVLSGGSSLSTSATQSSGGDIYLTAGNAIQLHDSGITAQAGPGGGGNIQLHAPSRTYLFNSTLTAQAVGDGGNLTVDGPVFFVLNHGGLISKSSSANGGNITALCDYFFESSSLIDASAPFGLPGTVTVTAPDVDLSSSLVPLPGNLLDLESELRPDCAVRLQGGISSFILLGRGGLPFEPGGFIPSGMGMSGDETP